MVISQENKPVAQFGMSEGVTSLAFSKVATRSPLLLAAMGGKALRAYDFRTPPASASAWSHEISPMEQPGISVTQSSIMSTKATLGVQANPHDENTFVSFGDGQLRLNCLSIALPAQADVRRSNHHHHQMASFDCGTCDAPASQCSSSPKAKQQIMAALHQSSHASSLRLCPTSY